MNIYTIYKSTNTFNNKTYIGFTTDFNKRKSEHKYRFKTGSTKFYNAIKKYGWQSFAWEIIYQSSEYEYTKNVMETYFINEYDSYVNGYNSTKGGDGIDSESARLFQQDMIKNNTHIFQGDKNPTYSRILNGTHNFLNNNFQRNISNNRVKNNTHNFQGARNPSHQRLIDGTHNLLGGEIQRKSSIKRLQDGTHNFIIQYTCPHCGKIGKGPNMKRYHFDKCKLK